MRVASVKGDMFKARRHLREYYGVFSKKVFISGSTSLNQIHKSGNVDIRMKKNKDINGFDIYVAPKKGKSCFVFPHIVIMGEKKQGGFL